MKQYFVQLDTHEELKIEASAVSVLSSGALVFHLVNDTAYLHDIEIIAPGKWLRCSMVRPEVPA